MLVFLFSVTLAKYLGVNITARKYKDSAQFHNKKKIVGENVVMLRSRLIRNKSKGLNLYTHTGSRGNTDSPKIGTGEAQGSFTLNLLSLVKPAGKRPQ